MTALSPAARHALSPRTALAVILALAAFAAPAARAQTYTWDPAANGSGSGGAGTWNTSLAIWFDPTVPGDIVWPNTATSAALFGGTGGTVTLGVPITANALTFNVTGYTVGNGGVAANTLTLAGTTPTVTVTNGADTAAISAIIAGSAGLTKEGAGTLTLSGVNTFTGGLVINNGTVAFGGADTALGAAGVTLNNGTTLSYTATTGTLTLTATRVITVPTGSTATIQQTGGTGAITTNGKITANTANSITGGGTLIKAGAADFQISAAQNFSGTFVVAGGVEISNNSAFGTGTVQLQKAGELVIGNGITIGNALTVTANGAAGANPILSTISGNTGVYAGAVAVNGPLTVALRDFNATGNGRNFTIGGNLSGAGTITLAGPTTLGGQALFITGNTAAGGYTGTIAVPAGLNVVFGSANAIGGATVTVASTTAGLGGISAGYDFGATPPAFANNLTGTATGGVFGINTTLAATTTVDQSTLGGGTMFLGSQGAGTYTAATLTPAAGGLYRLGGGGGTLTLSATNVLTGTNNLLVGDARINGGGTVVLTGTNDYSGTTTINGGALAISNAASLGTAASAIVAGAGGALQLNGGVVVGRSLTITGVTSGAAQNAGLVSNTGNNVYTGNITANNTASDNARITSATAGATLLITGNIVTANAATGLVFQGAGNTIQTGVISGPAILYSTSTGTVTLAGANTFVGRPWFQTGRVVVTTLNSVNGGTPLLAASSLGAPTTVANGFIDLGNSNTTGTLVYAGTGETTDRTVRLVGTSGGSVVEQSGTGALRFTTAAIASGVGSKTLTLGGSTAGTGEFAAAIPNNTTTGSTTLGATFATGATTVTLNSVDGIAVGATISGTGIAGGTTVTAINAGTRVVTLSTAATATSGTAQTAVYTVTGVTNLTSLLKTGTGTWTLSAANTYTGTTTVGGGNLILDFNAATAPATNVVAATSPLILGGGTLTVREVATAVANTQAFASTAVNAGGSAVAVNTNGGTGGAFVSLGAITRATGGTLNITQPSGTLSATNGVSTTTANVNGILGGWATVGGTDYAVSGASATAPITAFTGYTALPTATGAATTNYSLSGSQTQTAATAANVLKITDTGATQALALSTFPLTFASTGGILYAGGTANAYTISGSGAGIVGAGTGEFVVNVAANAALTITSSIITTTANTAGTLTKGGAGTLTLTPPTATISAFTGNIYVDGGVLAATLVTDANAGPLGGAFTTAAYKQVFLNGGTFRSTAALFNNNVPTGTKTGFVFNIGTGGGTLDVPSTNVLVIDEGANVTGTGTTASQLQGAGDLFKTGTGTLVLGNATSNFTNYTGRIFVNGGTLGLGGSSNNFGDLLNNTTVAGGAAVDLRGFTTSELFGVTGTGISSGGALVSSFGLGVANGAVTLAGNTSVGGAGTLTLAGPVAGASFGLTKVGTGVVALTGYNSYGPTSGVNTTVSAGTLLLGKTYSLPGYTTAANLPMQVTVATGATLAFAVGGANEFTAADVSTFLAGNVFPNGSGIGFDTTNAPGGTFTPPSLTVTNPAGVVTLNLVKLGTGTLVLPDTNTFGAGSTGVYGGTLQVPTTAAATNPLGTGALVLGGPNGGAAGNLDLGTSSQTVTSLTAASNSATASTLTVGAGQTLLVTGAVVIGVSPLANSATTTTKLTVVGATGTLSIGTAATPTNAGFQLGNSSVDSFSNAATLDLTGLGTFYANLGSGTFRVGDPTNGSGTGTAGSTLLLAPASTILATAITTDSPAGNAVAAQLIRLGTGMNTLQANTINIGGITNRAVSTLDFQSTTGTVTVRNLAGNGRAAVNVAYGNTATGFAPVGTINLAGHSADLLLSTLNVGGRTAATVGNGSSSTGTFTFGTGTLDATGVTVGFRAVTSGTGTSTGTVTFGGGNVTIGASGVAIAPNASTVVSNPAVGTVNVTGGTVNIGNTTTSVTLGSSANATNGPSTAALNISGGAVTVSGNIAPGTATGVTSTLALTAGSLNMTGKNIGASGVPLTTLTFTGGTLSNVGNVYQALTQTGATTTLNVTTTSTTVNGAAYTLTSGTVNIADTRTLTAQSAAVGGTTPTLGIGFASTTSTTSSGQLTTPGVIDLSAVTAANRLNIVLTDASNGANIFPATPLQDYFLTVVNAGGGIAFGGLFDPNAFNVTATNFTSANGFTVTNPSGGTLVISFQPVPEPVTVFGLAVGGLAAANYVRRRRLAAK